MRELSNSEKEKLSGLKIDQSKDILSKAIMEIRKTQEDRLADAKDHVACALKLLEEAIDLGAIEFREAKLRALQREELEEHRRKLERKIIKPYDGTMEDLKNMHVAELELTVRTLNNLKNMNITSVYELVQFTASQLVKSRCFGKISLRELEDKLAYKGLMLKQEEV